MMYGFGDDQNPYTESVDLLEDLVIEFITQMVGIHVLHFHQAFMHYKRKLPPSFTLAIMYYSLISLKKCRTYMADLVR